MEAFLAPIPASAQEPPPLGHAPPLDAPLSALPLVLWRVHSPVRRYEPGRPAESLLVMLEGGQQLVLVGRVAFQHPIAAYDGAFGLLQPHLVPVLGLLARLAPTDDARVLLEEAHQLLGRLNALAFEHPALGLVYHPLDQPFEAFELIC